MRKNLFILVFSFAFFVFVALFTGTKNANAACQLTPNPATVDQKYPGNITLNGNQDCFAPSISADSYFIIAFPPSNPKPAYQYYYDSITAEEGGGTAPTTGIPTQVNRTSVTGPLPMNEIYGYQGGFNGSMPIGQWTVAVCLQSSVGLASVDDLSKCASSAVATANITVTGVGGCNTTQDPPILNIKNNKCAIQIGKPLTLTVSNVKGGGQPYGAYFTDQAGDLGTVTSPNNCGDFPLTIGADKTANVQEGQHIVCVDWSGKNRTGTNCLTMNFTGASPDPANTACTASNQYQGGTFSNAVCNPKCSDGFNCVNVLSYAAANSGGGGILGVSGGGFSILNIFPGMTACVPTKPTPFPCKSDYDCVPYTCDQKANPKICTTTPIPTPTPYSTPSPLCPKDKCQTALGIIPTQPTAFIAQMLVIILSFAGGIAILLIINAGYHIMVSNGNPEKLQEAREGLTSALVGLLFIIFSVAILQLIAINILHIPGFTQ